MTRNIIFQQNLQSLQIQLCCGERSFYFIQVKLSSFQECVYPQYLQFNKSFTLQRCQVPQILYYISNNKNVIVKLNTSQVSYAKLGRVCLIIGSNMGLEYLAMRIAWVYSLYSHAYTVNISIDTVLYTQTSFSTQCTISETL